MLYTLENESIKLTVDSLGAEKKSLVGKRHMTEYLWNGDPAIWNRSAPILFPFVGRTKNGKYTINGREYQMDIHGFAKDSEFETAAAADRLTLTLRSNERTKEMYPFDFILHVAYILDGGSVTVCYDVENTGKTDMYFTFGAHPGFMCPMLEGESFDDYYFEFDKAETAEIMEVLPNCFFGRGTKPFLHNINRFDLNYDLFKNDALVFSNLKSHIIRLKSKKHKRYVEMDFSGFPYLGIWTKIDAPYVCIEPWLAHGDFDDFDGELINKPDISCLKPGEVFGVKHIVTVYE